MGVQWQSEIKATHPQQWGNSDTWWQQRMGNPQLQQRPLRKERPLTGAKSSVGLSTSSGHLGMGIQVPKSREATLDGKE